MGGHSYAFRKGAKHMMEKGISITSTPEKLEIHILEGAYYLSILLHSTEVQEN